MKLQYLLIKSVIIICDQVDIERQLQNLMLASLQRKEQFRQVWGVSPKSINQKRNQKLIIGAHEILFNDPEPKSEPTLTEINNIGIYEIFDEKVEIGNVEFEGQSDVMVPTMGEFEGILPSLDFSIPSDLFSQYIDANFQAFSRTGYIPFFSKSSIETRVFSPVKRLHTSTQLPSKVFLETIICVGIPRSSARENFAPVCSCVSS